MALHVASIGSPGATAPAQRHAFPLSVPAMRAVRRAGGGLPILQLERGRRRRRLGAMALWHIAFSGRLSCGMTDRMRSRQAEPRVALFDRGAPVRRQSRLSAVIILGVAACLIAGVSLSFALLSRHPAPWFPALYGSPPPTAMSPPGPGIYLRAPVVQQAYPLDCEAAALQVALASKGIRVTQQQIFERLPLDPRAPLTESDGQPTQWGDPYKAFVGNVQGEESDLSGYGVYFPPIAAVATELGARADGRTGWTVGAIEDEILQGNPVVVWVDFAFRARQLSYWTAWDGTRVPYIIGEHAVTVVGFDPQGETLTVVDVLRGVLHTFSARAFTAALSTFGGMGVAISL